MKILHIIPTNGLGGVPVVLRNLIICMPDHSHYIYGEINMDGMDFSDVSAEVFDGRTRILSIVTFWHLMKIVISRDISIIHSHGKGPGFYSRILKLFLGVKVVHTFHGFRNRFDGLSALMYLAFERSVSYFTDSLIALSESERLEVCKALGLPSTTSRLSVIPNFYIPLSEKKFERIHKGKFIVGNIGRMSHQKNQKLILKIAEKFLEDDEILFVLIGGAAIEDRNYYFEVQRIIRQLKLNNVLCFGPVENASSCLGGFDLYLSTSLWEGLPTVLLESFDYGIPVAASSCMGNVDLINEKTGVLLNIDDLDSIVTEIDKIRKLELGEKTEMRKAQKDYLERFCSVEGVRKKLDELYLS